MKYSGLELSRLFFQEAVKPILDVEFPGLLYSAALIGPGSEVLGFDTQMSTDHGWGPRLLLFLKEEDFQPSRDAIDETLRRQLPHSFRGYPTNFTTPDPNDNGTQHLAATESGPVNHKVEIHTTRCFILSQLNFDISHTIEPADWLTFPTQRLRTITAGAVFRDEAGFQAVRDKFAYYPRDVWLYLLAANWARIGQEEHLMGRAGMVDDEIGSALIGSRLVRDVMRLCFLLERQYAPYPKWFGTAFKGLACAAGLSPHLRGAQLAGDWQERERHLAAAYEQLAALHNALQITEPLPAQVRNFFGRPFKVIALHGFADALRARITDEEVRRIASRRLIGGIDQFSDNTDLLEHTGFRHALRRLYD